MQSARGGGETATPHPVAAARAGLEEGLSGASGHQPPRVGEGSLEGGGGLEGGHASLPPSTPNSIN